MGYFEGTTVYGCEFLPFPFPCLALKPHHQGYGLIGNDFKNYKLTFG